MGFRWSRVQIPAARPKSSSMKRSIFFFCILAVALSGVAVAESFTFQVVGIQCAACAPPVQKALRSLEGIKSAVVDWKASTATVELAPGFDKTQVKTALAASGYGAVFPGETGGDLKPLTDELRNTLDLITYADGKRFRIDDLLAGGKITVVDFYADWCGPCHVLDTRMQHYMLSHPGIALRRINMGKWDTEAAKQATREFRVAALPYVRVYDANGKLVKALTGGMWDEVLAAVEPQNGK